LTNPIFLFSRPLTAHSSFQSRSYIRTSRVHFSVCMHVCMHVCMYAGVNCLCVMLPIYMHMCVHVCMCVHMRVFMHIFMCMCSTYLHLYVCIYSNFQSSIHHFDLVLIVVFFARILSGYEVVLISLLSYSQGPCIVHVYAIYIFYICIFAHV
jgi:hypothetical protein